MLQINSNITAEQLASKIKRLFELSEKKILSIENTWEKSRGTPVFTVEGKYTVRGWTEWTRGFQFGSALLQYDATGEQAFLDIGLNGTLDHMAGHVSHIGVHDHGFNNVSTYGNILRLIGEGRIEDNGYLAEICRLALKISGAVQASRWTPLTEHLGFIHSFNGSHSLFIDTMRSLRVLALSHSLGHALMGEQDEKISLLLRLLQHAETTARFTVYWGKGRDSYDIRGRTSHESIFNPKNGSFRCPSTQQGYSPFSTWTRGLAWAVLGYAEQLAYLNTLKDEEFKCDPCIHDGDKNRWIQRFVAAAEATADCYIACTATDGIPYWDTGAPGLAMMPGWMDRPADPFNDFEPVDSSAAAIAAQGLLHLGSYLNRRKPSRGDHYIQAGLTVADTLFAEPYLSVDKNHQGLLLHSIYHRPNGWDFVPPGRTIPCGESSMWGDYHARELALMIWRIAESKPGYCFFATIV
ncbi:MAG: glycosyl hydrolase [Deltaproteobacteria bacterium SG8_13]|nr:MAG: glycosyl hydrolase [Deltaproteobacteria bacterium SG8_13]